MLFLNKIKPALNSKKIAKRVGRGIGSGLGKTAGRGHKGQKSRAGGFHKVGFEGGQMPIQRRLPKRGFNALNASKTACVRTADLVRLSDDLIDVSCLANHGIIPCGVSKVKVYLSGDVQVKLNIKGILLTKGARLAIESAGGRISD